MEASCPEARYSAAKLPAKQPLEQTAMLQSNCCKPPVARAEAQEGVSLPQMPPSALVLANICIVLITHPSPSILPCKAIPCGPIYFALLTESPYLSDWGLFELLGIFEQQVPAPAVDCQPSQLAHFGWYTF